MPGCDRMESKDVLRSPCRAWPVEGEYKKKKKEKNVWRKFKQCQSDNLIEVAGLLKCKGARFSFYFHIFLCCGVCVFFSFILLIFFSALFYCAGISFGRALSMLYLLNRLLIKRKYPLVTSRTIFHGRRCDDAMIYHTAPLVSWLGWMGDILGL